jgi:Protein of unknown function DUF262/Protein of unknown function (DUF1524)
MSSHIDSDKIYITDAMSLWYRVPDYQRPYVWEIDQVNDLLDDIANAAATKSDAEYFLGSIVLQQREVNGIDGKGYRENDLLDGQQRLTTCLMIHAVARDITDDKKLKETCHKAVFQEANEYDAIPERFRIAFDIREDVRDFAKKVLEASDGTLASNKFLQSAAKSKDISIRNMAAAINHIREYLSGSEAPQLKEFFPFFRNKVLLIYVASTELDDAFRLFTVLNDRGVRLRGTDILKTMNLRALKIGGGSESDEKQAASMWEEIEGDFEGGFDPFLSHLRTVLVKEKARLNLLQEFEESIYEPRRYLKEEIRYEKLRPLLKPGRDTFEFVKRYRDHYSKVLSGSNHEIGNSWEFDNLITLLRDAALADFWLPPLLCYRDIYGEERIMEFLRKLENKFLGDWIARETPTARLEAMNSILKEMDALKRTSKPVTVQIAALLNSSLFEFDTQTFFRQLSENDVYGRRYARYVLYKIDMLLGGVHTRLQPPQNISVEHILPQNPESGSQWCLDFSDTARDDWTDKLGNLVLISRSKNSSQGRFEYKKKVDRYFKSNIETFPNSLRALRSPSWTPTDLEAHHMESLKVLRDYLEYER